MIRIGKYLPSYFSTNYGATAKKYEKFPTKRDSCWLEWQQMQTEFYMANQRQGVGSVVNDSVML